MIRRNKSIHAICASLLFLLGCESVFAQWQDGEGFSRFYDIRRSQSIQDIIQSYDQSPAQSDELEQSDAPVQDDSPGQSGNSHGKFYGIGQPGTTQDLPPGQLRLTLEGLPPRARGKALGWLQNFSFPAEDVKNLRADQQGAIYYADTFVPEPADASQAESSSAGSPAVDPDQVFKLHSRPGSSNVVFLDFDGDTIEDNAWNYYLDPVLEALPFDPSNNDNPAMVANFTQDELNRIAEIWHRIATDYAAFDIDITTEEPSVLTNTTGRILFTHDTDAAGRTMPSQNAGGVAYVNVWGWSNFATYYSPALVYYTNLYTNNHGYPTLVAEAGSHELGHQLGLSHDGVTGGSSYYEGHGSGLVDWGPIMGAAYSRNVTQWSKGEYSGANNPEDDLAIIAEKLPFIADDHGNSSSQATALMIDADGTIVSSSPELDPDNILTENKGVIGNRDDIDWFYVDVTGSGTLEITSTPSWHSFTRSGHRGENLDIELSLFDPSLTLIAVDEPGDNTGAAVTASVTPGRYYVQVEGVGNFSNSDYSDYSSVGMFFIEGTIPTDSSQADTTPPSPAQMTWQSAPQATGTSTINMISITAEDESGGVEYYFSCVAGGSGCTDSGWQTSRSWSPGGLDADTYYSYKVSARDGSGNQNGVSSTMGDTTDAPPPPTENNAPSAVAAYSPDPAVITKGKTASVTLDGSGSSDSDGSIASWLWKDASGGTVSTNTAVITKLQKGTYNFTLTVTDDDGATDSTSLSVSVTKPADDGGGGGRKGKPSKG